MSIYSMDASITTTTTSCSDCKLEHIEKRWTQVLIRWLNECVFGRPTITRLNSISLLEVINKYKEDICADEMERRLLCSEDLEAFIKYKYPILRLNNYCEEKEYYKKLYILSSVLLYHCCISSINGYVDSAICAQLDKSEQELILKFCEGLKDMEVTFNNVNCAIKDACNIIKLSKYKKQHQNKMLLEKPLADASGESCVASDFTLKALSRMSISSDQFQKKNIKFKSSVTVLPSVVTETSSLSDVDYDLDYSLSSKPDMVPETVVAPTQIEGAKTFIMESKSSERSRCLPSCTCGKCGSDITCGDSGIVGKQCKDSKFDIIKKRLSEPKSFRKKEIFYILVIITLISVFIAVVLSLTLTLKKPKVNTIESRSLVATSNIRKLRDENRVFRSNSFVCKNGLCKKVYVPTNEDIYLSLSRCILQCMGPQLWPQPIGYTYFSKNIIALSTTKMEYNIQSIPSLAVNQYLAEAFKLFIGDLVKLEQTKSRSKKNLTKDLDFKKMHIQLEVESDPDPRVKLFTDESYILKVDNSGNIAMIRIVSPSFCGVRHGLETLSQMILFDEASGHIISLDNIVIKDAPSYRYRGLMIDTGRNFIPVPDLMRTIDGMSTCKLNTFHWRISDTASFPLQITSIPQLTQYGAYDKRLIYTRDDVLAVVKRAGVRGIRVLIEVAAPGPVGRAWSWSPDASCPARNSSNSCSNILCLRLSMTESIMDILQAIYTEIFEMTKVTDIFHLSDSLASLVNCFYLVEERQGFLEKALERLKIANKGFLPKLPIIWYSRHLSKDYEAKFWERSWQEMYSWKSWRTLETFTTEGGEAVLWTDLVDSSNLDYHLWPRAAAVAERLWSDIAINGSASASVYVRLDNQRWRMLRKSVDVQPVWPMYCTYNPENCLHKLHSQK